MSPTLMSLNPNPLLHGLFYPSPLALLPPSPTTRNPPSTVCYPFIYLFTSPKYVQRFQNYYTKTHDKQFYQLEYSAYVQFLLSFDIPFPVRTPFSKVTQLNTFFSPSPSVRLSYIGNTIIFFCHSLHSILKSPNPLMFQICTQQGSLCIAKFSGF